MCITKVESFQFAGKLYETEIAAVTAALTEIGSNIVKKHSGNPVAGLIEQPMELVTLLTRYHALSTGAK